LLDLRRFHDSERSELPFGNQRAFFLKIWCRLHQNDSEVSESPVPSPQMASFPNANPFSIEMPGAAAKQGGSTDSLHGMIASMNRTSSAEPMRNKVAPESA